MPPRVCMMRGLSRGQGSTSLITKIVLLPQTGNMASSFGSVSDVCIAIGVFSNRQPGRLHDDFENRYAWVQILAPECHELVQIKLKIQMEPKESIQIEPIESIQMKPIESIQMKLKILG